MKATAPEKAPASKSERAPTSKRAPAIDRDYLSMAPASKKTKVNCYPLDVDGREDNSDYEVKR